MCKIIRTLNDIPKDEMDLNKYKNVEIVEQKEVKI